MSNTHSHYYVPESSHWPIVGSLGLFTIMLGAINWVHGHVVGPWFFAAGALVIVFMLFGWFRAVIRESLQGAYNKQVDHSFRWGMVWFIFSEIMFFAAFFGALFYVRTFTVPWMGGYGDHSKLTWYLLWPEFKAIWPLIINPEPNLFAGPKGIIGAWGIPAINTLILLTSGVTITFAHWGLLNNKRKQLIINMCLTVLLGVIFLALQVHEYMLAYTEYGLTLNSGIYGTTFFMLTGFHGLHVTIGTIMLIVITVRCWKGHFSPKNHFGFEAVAWYWHFVDVVWLFLFVFVYWL